MPASHEYCVVGFRSVAAAERAVDPGRRSVQTRTERAFYAGDVAAADLEADDAVSWDAASSASSRAGGRVGDLSGNEIVNQLSAEELNPALNSLGSGRAGCTTRRSAPNMITRWAPPPRTAISAVCSTSSNRGLAARLYHAVHGRGVSALTTACCSTRASTSASNVNINATTRCRIAKPLALGGVLTSAPTTAPAYQNNGPTDRKLDEGPSLADRRHLFNLTRCCARLILMARSVSSPPAGRRQPSWQIRSADRSMWSRAGDPAFNGFTDQCTHASGQTWYRGVSPYGDRSGLTGYYNMRHSASPRRARWAMRRNNMLRGPASGSGTSRSCGLRPRQQQSHRACAPEAINLGQTTSTAEIRARTPQQPGDVWTDHVSGA